MFEDILSNGRNIKLDCHVWVTATYKAFLLEGYWLLVKQKVSVRILSVLRGHSFFFIPAITANDLRLRRIFYPRFYPLHLFSYLNSWERASIFPFEGSVLNKGTTGTILYRFWYDAVLGLRLNPGPPALEASIIPLGYRGGGDISNVFF